MDQELWDKISNLFDAALERPAAERYSYLESACGGDDVLLRRVSQLLSQLDQAGTFLEQPIFSRPPALSVSSVIGNRYRIDALIGRGGMGEVYRAYDALVGEHVALKTLRPELGGDEDFLRRFRREIQLARKVTHPSVCRVFDVGIHEFEGGHRIPFFAMQLLDGETLAARIKRDGRLSDDEALPVVQHLAAGLEAAHAAGIIHRDFKSANVMLAQRGAVIMDFGLARAALVDADTTDADRSLSARAQLAGTFAYMSPEQLSGGEVTTATDIYSLGVVLFEMATGRIPFDDPNLIRSAMQRAKEGAPDVRQMAPELDTQWGAVIARCLQRDPSKRFASAREVAARLQPRRRPPMVYWTRRQWLMAAGATAAAASVALIPAGFRYYRQSSVLPEGAEVFLGSINNLTDDGRFAGVTELFRNQLAQSARVNVIDGRRVADVLLQMGMPDDEQVEPTAVREAAWRLNAPLALYGTVTRVGSDYVLNVQAETRGSRPDSPNEKFLRSFSAADPAALMRAVRDASRWVREVAGESAESIASFDRLPADTTTPSWEALAYFARGQRLYMINDWEGAALQFEAALREDEGFTLAAMRRADILMSQSRQTAGIAQWRTAVAMLDERQVTRAEELYGHSMFAFDSGDMEAAERYARTWSGEYPNDWRAPYFRALPLCLNGHAAQAVEVLEPLREVLADYGDLYVQLIACRLVLGQMDRARELIPIVRRLGRPERADLREAYVRYREGDCVGCLAVLRALQQSNYRRGATDGMLQEALLLIDGGYLDEAATNIERFLTRGSWVETAPQESALRAAQAWAEMLQGKFSAAVAHARMALGPESGPLIVALSGTVFARSGARELVSATLERIASFQDIRSYRIARHRIEGELALSEGNTAAGLVALRAAAALEPVIAHRQYLIEALPQGSDERLQLAIKAAEVPWQSLRPPSMHHIGTMRTVVADLVAAGAANGFVTEFASTSKELASEI